MKERIRSVMQYAKLSQQDFAARLGISPATLSGIFSGRVNSADKYVNAIHQAFPEISVSWLLFGEGEMLCCDPVTAASPTEGLPAGSLLDENGAESGAAVSPDGVPYGPGHTGRIISQPTPEQLLAGKEMRARMLAQAAMAGAQNTRSDFSGMGINLDKPHRKIKEIRVFFDDGTYEAFVPSGK